MKLWVHAKFLLECPLRIGRTTVCTNYGQEVFLFQKLAMASKESLLKDFPKDWLHWIEVELACERKGAKGTWYNAPAVLLAMLVWKVCKSLFSIGSVFDIHGSNFLMRNIVVFDRKSLMQLLPKS